MLSKYLKCELVSYFFFTFAFELGSEIVFLYLARTLEVKLTVVMGIGR